MIFAARVFPFFISGSATESCNIITIACYADRFINILFFYNYYLGAA